MKSWIIIAVLIVVALIVYYSFFNNTNSADSTLQAQSSENVIGADTLSLLNQIQSLKIDKSFFQTAEYLSLMDYTVQIPAVNIGRMNPFAPLASVSRPATSSPIRR